MSAIHYSPYNYGPCNCSPPGQTIHTGDCASGYISDPFGQLPHFSAWTSETEKGLPEHNTPYFAEFRTGFYSQAVLRPDGQWLYAAYAEGLKFRGWKPIDAPVRWTTEDLAQKPEAQRPTAYVPTCKERFEAWALAQGLDCLEAAMQYAAEHDQRTAALKASHAEDLLRYKKDVAYWKLLEIKLLSKLPETPELKAFKAEFDQKFDAMTDEDLLEALGRAGKGGLAEEIEEDLWLIANRRVQELEVQVRTQQQTIKTLREEGDLQAMVITDLRTENKRLRNELEASQADARRLRSRKIAWEDTPADTQ